MKFPKELFITMGVAVVVMLSAYGLFKGCALGAEKASSVIKETTISCGVCKSENIKLIRDAYTKPNDYSISHRSYFCYDCGKQYPYQTILVNGKELDRTWTNIDFFFGN